MKIYIYNTLSGKKEEFIPIKTEKVGMYVCGPTVYNFDHLGHARTHLFFDVFRRFLKACGYEVIFVQNITDVGHLVGDMDMGEDKLEKQAKVERKTPEEIARFYESAHFEDMAKIGVTKPDYNPRASEYIPKIIKYIELLVEKKYAYVTEKGNVYFDVRTFKKYGQLSHRKLEDMVKDTRISSEQDKRYPADFGLWKVGKGDEMRIYDSPWGKGIPGWHIECSVMSADILGQPFDIHGSAVEHVFPHHENEIAQSESAYNKPLANYWVHTGMLMVNGKKMGKSLGNSIVLREVLKNISPEVLRLVLLSAHYRKPLEYQESIVKQWENIWLDIKKVYTIPDNKNNGYYEKFINYLSDDMNIPGAINFLIQSLSKISQADLTKSLAILGLEYTSSPLDSEIQELVNQRDKARKENNWALADKLRIQIEDKRYIVEDTPQGTRVTSKN